MLHSICEQILKLSSGHRTGKVTLIAITKKGYFKECSTTTQLHSSHMLPKKFLQASLQQYMNCEVLYIQVGFRKGRGTRDQIVNIHWIIKKAREFQKYTYFCFIEHAKVFDYGLQQNLENLQRLESQTTLFSF